MIALPAHSAETVTRDGTISQQLNAAILWANLAKVKGIDTVTSFFRGNAETAINGNSQTQMHPIKTSPK